MTYADSLLTDGEHVVVRARAHWLSLLSKSRAGLLLWFIAIVLFVAIVWFKVGPGLLRDLPTWLALLLVVIGAALIAYRIWQWRAQEYIVTNFRLLKVGGIVNKRSGDSSLEKINDAILVQPLMGRMLNFGDLQILTAAEEAVDTYRMLKDPKGFKKSMLTQKHALETGMSYGDYLPPTPPLRAQPAVASAPVAPVAPPPMIPVPPPGSVAPPQVAQPVPAPAPSAVADPAPMPSAVAPEHSIDHSLAVTETLARLADLRDSGAISAEEYESKKTELLGRL